MADYKSPKSEKDSKKSSTYPECLIIPPLQDHKQTFIVLHGRGSNAETFGPPFLDTEVSGSQTFRSAFPNAQFIFPTASKRRARIYNRSIINQWFDNWSLETPDERKELQVEGLRESSAYIHSLLADAIKQVGANNVVLGGLSQGCAAALVALLTWDGEPVAAGFGMCGWLPFRKQMEDILVAYDRSTVEDAAGGGEDVFGTDGEGGGNGGLDTPMQAIKFLKEEVEMPVGSDSVRLRQIPLFLSHGVEDPKVKVGLGREAVSCLERLGVDVRWREYEGLGHWYSSAMLDDLVLSLSLSIGLEVHR
ncbi:MAG: hypothetical protein Q9168_008341 [Polycauliona sp. 1 TL-2023]